MILAACCCHGHVKSGDLWILRTKHLTLHGMCGMLHHLSETTSLAHRCLLPTFIGFKQVPWPHCAPKWICDSNGSFIICQRQFQTSLNCLNIENTALSDSRFWSFGVKSELKERISEKKKLQLFKEDLFPIISFMLELWNGPRSKI